jgi:UDP-glucose 4-epimerase
MFPLDFAGTILVTGASGFVGRHALPALRVSFPKAQLVAAHGRTDSLYPLADHTLALNLFEAASIEAAILDSKPDVVLHLASQSAVSLAFSDPIATWRANLMGTIHLLRFTDFLLRRTVLSRKMHRLHRLIPMLLPKLQLIWRLVRWRCEGCVPFACAPSIM